jgi:hypothetical protein
MTKEAPSNICVFCSVVLSFLVVVVVVVVVAATETCRNLDDCVIIALLYK